jgi:MraZ protein
VDQEFTFRGTFPCTVDQKRRLTVPSRFAKALTPRAKRTFVAVHGQERCLSIYPLDWWQVYERQLHAAQSTDAEIRRALRRLLASTEDVQLDNQNRITLSPSHLEYAGIRGAAVLNGLVEKLELWSPDNWQRYLDEDGAPSFEATMERLGPIMEKTNAIVLEERARSGGGDGEA